MISIDPRIDRACQRDPSLLSRNRGGAPPGSIIYIDLTSELHLSVNRYYGYRDEVRYR